KSDGSIISWGEDWEGQVSNTPSGTDFTAIAGGEYHSLALKSDGSIVSWGRDNYNQVTNTPTGTGFTHIAGGGYHSLAFTIPEPHTLLLASLASLGLTLRRRRSAR
ncbi:MAG: PEP-CTERM sorting domain-containing protein, partial [Pirellulales bacterium]|nr:PEP-CTERM sorting domain-containing protein [Pirellulales bacterium]